MKKIKLLSFLLAFTLCLTSNVYAYEINQADTVVTIAGSEETDSDVRLKVTDTANELVWIDSVSANESGTYSFRVNLPVKTVRTNYKLLVNGILASEVTVLPDNEVIELFASATLDSVESLLTTYSTRLEIDLTDGYGAEERSLVNSIFLKNVGTGIREISDSFKRSVAINKINHADRSTLGTILKANASELNIQYESEVEILSNAKQEAFVISMLGKTYEDYPTFLTGYSDALEVAKSTSEPTESIDPPHVTRPSGAGGGGGSIATPGISDSNSSIENTDTVQKTDVIFKDLASVPWAATHINNLYVKGVIAGKSTESFAPQDAVTREEFVAMIVRMFNLTATNGSNFVDVAGDAWYKKAVDAAVDNGIITGITAENFGAGRPVSRQDCAVICARVLTHIGIEANADAATFADHETIAEYAKDSVYIMKKLGIINGMGDNNFNPDETCTRAMAAKIVDMLGGVTL